MMMVNIAHFQKRSTVKFKTGALHAHPRVCLGGTTKDVGGPRAR
jgi:hypothetical protein